MISKITSNLLMSGLSQKAALDPNTAKDYIKEVLTFLEVPPSSIVSVKNNSFLILLKTLPKYSKLVSNFKEMKLARPNVSISIGINKLFVEISIKADSEDAPIVYFGFPLRTRTCVVNFS